MITTFKTRIYPSGDQKEYFEKAFGMRRFAYNWALDKAVEFYKTGRGLHPYQLVKDFNALLKTDETLAWCKEINSMVRQEAFEDLSLAMQKWKKLQVVSRETTERMSTDKGKPHYASRKNPVQSFRIFAKMENSFRVEGPHTLTMNVTRAYGRMTLKTRESIKRLMGAKLKTLTIMRQAGQYWLCIAYERTNHAPQTNGGRLGLDLGIHAPAIGYDGSESFRFGLGKDDLRKAKANRKRKQRKLAAKTKDSKRYAKALLQLEKTYLKEANIRKDRREKDTTWILTHYQQVMIDDFSFESAKKLDVNEALYETCPYAFKLRLEQKAEKFGCSVSYVPKGTPTTKTCSHCGHVQKMGLGDRTYVCPECGFTADRDLNSAINVYNMMI